MCKFLRKKGVCFIMVNLKKIVVGLLVALLIFDPVMVVNVAQATGITGGGVDEEIYQEIEDEMDDGQLQLDDPESQDDDGVEDKETEDEDAVYVVEDEEEADDETDPFLNMPVSIPVNPENVSFAVSLFGEVSWAIVDASGMVNVSGDAMRWDNVSRNLHGLVGVNAETGAVEIGNDVFESLFDGVYLLRFQVTDLVTGEFTQDELFFFEIQVAVDDESILEPDDEEIDDDEADLCLDDDGAEVDCPEICFDDEGEETDCPEICLDDEGEETECPEICLDEDGEEKECVEILPFNAVLCEGTGMNNVMCGNLRFDLTTTGNGANARRTATVRNVAFGQSPNTGNPSGISMNENFSSTVPFVIPETVIQEGVAYTVTAIGRRGNNDTGHGAFQGIATSPGRDILFEIPETIEHIGDDAFLNTRVITREGVLDLSNLTNLRAIGENSFAFNTVGGPTGWSLAHELILPPNLQTIGNSAFSGVPAAGAASSLGRFVGELHIPHSVTSIGTSPFRGTKITHITHAPFFNPFTGLLSVADDLGFNPVRDQYESVVVARSNRGTSLLEKATRWSNPVASEGVIRIDYGNVSPGLINADIIIVADFSISMFAPSGAAILPTAPGIDGIMRTYPRSLLQDEIMRRTVNAIFDANDIYEEFDIRVGITSFGSVSGSGNTGGISSTRQPDEPTAHIFHELTNSRSSIISAMRSQTGGGSTNYNAGLQDALDMIVNRPANEQNRPAMVLFLTDGEPNPINADGLPQANALRDLGVPVFPIAVFEDINRVVTTQGANGRTVGDFMRAVSEDGNTVFEGRSTEELENIIRRIAEDHMQFLPETEVVDIIASQFELRDMADLNSELNYEATAGVVTFEVIDGRITARWDLSGAPAGRVHTLNINVRLRDEYQESTGDFRTNDNLHVFRDDDDETPFRDDNGNINSELAPEHEISGGEGPILGRWHVYYRFESLTSWRELPVEILNLLPGAEELNPAVNRDGEYFTRRDGLFGNVMRSPDAIDLAPNADSEIIVEVADGFWRFIGWDREEQRISGGSIDFTGRWEFHRAPGISAEVIGGAPDSFSPERLPVNPDQVIIRPVLPGIDAENIPNDNIAWEIIDRNGNVVVGGNGNSWWTYERDGLGNLIQVPGGVISRDEQGYVVIPESIIDDLDDGNYRIIFAVTDPDNASNYSSGQVEFITRYPEITVVIEGDLDILGGTRLQLNPEYLVVNPRIDGVDTRLIPDDAIRWEIIDTDTNVIRVGNGSSWWTVDAAGNITDGPSGTVTRDAAGNIIIDRDELRLTGGRYTITALITDPDTRETDRSTQDFIIREVRISSAAPGSVLDTLMGATLRPIVNPETLEIHPVITGVETTDIPSEDIAWTIVRAQEGAQFAGNGERWWEVDANGVEIEGTGGPVARDNLGNVIIPQDVVGRLTGGEYALIMDIVDRDTNVSSGANMPFIIRNPEAEITGNRHINPAVIIGAPNITGVEPQRIPHSAIYWNISDEFGNPVIGGNGNTWWAYEREPMYILDGEGQLVPNPNGGRTVVDELGNPVRQVGVGGTIDRNMEDYVGDPERGMFKITQEVIDLLDIGNYRVGIVVTDPDTGLTATDHWDFIIREPGAHIIGNRDVNPNEIKGMPSNTDSGVNPADIADDDISWTISDSSGGVVLAGNGSSWWTVDPATGNRNPDGAYGDLVRDEVTGEFTIGQSIINRLPEGEYVIEMTVRDEVTNLTESDRWPFTLVDPVVDLVVVIPDGVLIPEYDDSGDLINTPVNPETITANPTLPGLPGTSLPDTAITWEIRDRDGNPVLDETGRPITGTGPVVDIDDLDLPDGEYNIIFVVTDPETGRTGEVDIDFTLRNSGAEITGNRPYNPEYIIGTPAIPGVDSSVINDEDISWTIRDAEGNPVIGGNGSQWWVYERGEDGNFNRVPDSGSEDASNTYEVTRNDNGQVIIPEEVINLLPGGDYTVTMVVTDPNDADNCDDASWDFTILAPSVVINNPVNPEVGDVIIRPALPDSDLEWTISDSNGNPIFGGDNENWWIYERDSDGELMQVPGGNLTADEETGEIVIPPSIINQLPGGDYTLEVIETHPEYGEIGTDSGDFIISRPSVDIDSPLNPEDIGIRPGNPNADLEWTVVGPDGPIAGGDSEYWWTYERDEEGNIVRVPGGELETTPDGTIILPPEIIEEITDGGDYTLIITEDHDDHGEIRNEVIDIIITRPGLDVDRPFNPDDLVIIPGHPETELEWTVTNPEGNPVIGGDRENWWTYERDEEGNIVRVPGGDITIDEETGGIRIPEDALDQLPEGDYSLEVIEIHPTFPDLGNIRGDEENNFTITRPGGNNNSGELIVRPGHPETDTTWQIRDEDGNAIAGGSDEDEWWFYERDPDGSNVVDEQGNPVRVPDSGGYTDRDGDGNIIIPPSIIDNLPEGDYTLVVVENHPDYDEIAREEVPFYVRDIEINVEINRVINPEKITGIPNIPGRPNTDFAPGDVVWVIRDSSGTIVAEGTGREISEQVLNNLSSGNFQAEFTATDPVTNKTASDSVDFTIRRPHITINIEGGMAQGDRVVNPERIIGTPTFETSTVTWVIRDASGNIVARGEGNIIDNGAIQNLPNGDFVVEFTEYDPESGLSHVNSSNFTIRNTNRPGVDVGVDNNGTLNINAPEECSVAADRNGNLVITCPEGINPPLNLPPGWIIINRDVDADGNLIITVNPPRGWVVRDGANGTLVLRPVTRPGGGGSWTWNNSGDGNNNDNDNERNNQREITVEVESEEIRINIPRPGLPQTGTAVSSLTAIGIGILSTGSALSIVKKRIKKKK